MVGVVERRKATVVIVMDIAALIRLSSIFGNALYASVIVSKGLVRQNIPSRLLALLERNLDLSAIRSSSCLV